MAQKNDLLSKVTDDLGEMAKHIVSIKRRSSDLRRDVALAAASAILCAIKHRDVSCATQLCDALGEGWRVNALRAWFIEFGPMRWQEATVTPDGSKISARFKLDDTKLEQLKKDLAGDRLALVSAWVNEKPFWVYKPEPEFKGGDFLRTVEQAISRFEKMAKEHPEALEDGRLHVDGIDSIRTTLTGIKAQLNAKRTAELTEEDEEGGSSEGSPSEAATVASMH